MQLQETLSRAARWTALALAFIAQPAFGETVVPPNRMAAIDVLAAQAVADVPLAGLSIAITQGGRLIHAGGYGYANLEHKVPATPRTVYRIGSVTKQFTAAAVLQLVVAGRLGLDDDICKYLPEFQTGGRVVTIRQLLNHTSGIRSLSEIPQAMANRSLDVSQGQIMAWIGAEPFDFEPGQAFRYNNSGPWLLGVIVERLTGVSYGDHLRKTLFAPLDLQRTLYDSYQAIIPDRAQGYSWQNVQFENAEPNSSTRPFASGALLSTVLDLVAWVDALFAGRVVDGELLQLMTSPSRLNTGEPVPYGFGLQVADVDGRRRIAHAGEQIGYRALLAHYPDANLTIALLTNTQWPNNQPPPLAKLETAIVRLLLSNDRPAAAAELRQSEAAPSAATRLRASMGSGAGRTRCL